MKPEHDPEVDGNRFNWIKRQSQIVREQRQHAKGIPLLSEAELEQLRAHDEAIENEERANFQRMRAKAACARK